MISCPHCRREIGGAATEGGGAMRVRLGIVVAKADGEIGGPCPHCKGHVVLTGDNGVLAKSLSAAAPERPRRLGFRIPAPAGA